MRSFVWALGLLAAAAGIVMAAAPASAQSFFEKLFGLGAPAARAAHGPGSRSPALRRPASEGAKRRHRRDPDRDDDDRPGRDRSGKVRTVCVRLCDGFYFPVSNATSMRNLVRDQRKCQASCGQDAMLFYEPAPGGDAGALVDVGGRPYSGLPHAFLYRQTRVAGCACKPEPWSLAERERHLRYAAEAAERKAALAASAEAEKPQQPARQITAAAASAPTLTPGSSSDPCARGRQFSQYIDCVLNSGTSADSHPGPEGPPRNTSDKSPPPAAPPPAAPLPAAVTPAAVTPEPGQIAVVVSPPVPPPPSPAPVAAAAALDSPPTADETDLIAPVVRSRTSTAPVAAASTTAGPAPALSTTERPARRQAAPSRRAASASHEVRETRRSSRAQPPAERHAPRHQRRVADTASNSWFGKSKFVYPGDPPPRYR